MNMITARRHAEAQPTPLVMVVESVPDISEMLQDLCDFLRIRIVRVAAGAALARELLIERPICILAHAPQAGPEVCDTLVAIAQHDPTLPVLLVTANSLDDPPEPHSIQPLSNLTWIAQRPGLRMLVEFLFMAERHTDTPGLMPIA